MPGLTSTESKSPGQSTGTVSLFTSLMNEQLFTDTDSKHCHSALYSEKTNPKTALCTNSVGDIDLSQDDHSFESCEDSNELQIKSHSLVLDDSTHRYEEQQQNSESSGSNNCDHRYLKSVQQHLNIDNNIYGDSEQYSSLQLMSENGCYTGIETEEDITDIRTISEESHAVISEFQKLKANVRDIVSAPYSLHPNNDIDRIQIVEMYPSSGKIYVKLNINIDEFFNAKIYVHGIEISADHDMWIGLPAIYNNINAISSLLSKLSSYSVCVGNSEDDFQELVPVGSLIQHNDDSSNTNSGYREGDFGAACGSFMYSSTVRSTKCLFLVNGARCSHCSKFRNVPRARKSRLADKQKNISTTNFLSKGHKHSTMSKDDLIGKIHQQKTMISSLEKEVGRLQRKFRSEVEAKGVDLNLVQSMEMSDLMASCRDDIEQAFPDANSFQRLFWNEQYKSAKVKSSKGMRWHPMIIRWCIYLRHKSSAAYEAMRDSGFVNLPSSRTLFDYTHYLKSALGFQPDVVGMLKKEAEKCKMLDDHEPYRCFIGILFDEIKIKSDLVYDKHTGELIGFCNLDNVGNQIMNFDKCCHLEENHKQSSDIAKFMLVLMVRGIASDLQFPFAAFATNSITSDFLYSIIWKACRILEGTVKLKVLFFTCDGASANRKFFNMHSVDEFVYCTTNPHDKTRKIYFISDVPHLMKTTRNCFANSYSHKNTRKLWKHGKDISWMSILKLYEEHCEFGIYNQCPKLSRAHVDLTAFSYMKVNLAVQVLSSTVANSLEICFDDAISETVTFIRKMNKFFDCLNVRGLFEGQHSRNASKEPYYTINDRRLKWLKDDFLGYFNDWEQSVRCRPGEFSKSVRNGMMLSQQTLNGLKITVHSIVDSITFLLSAGLPFVLTSVFNQDPLEQQFGNYRHRAGDNCNPTAYDIRNAITELRAVGATALAPKRGNITKSQQTRNKIDNTPLPRRKHNTNRLR